MPLIRDILVEAHGGVTNGVSVAFAHGEDLAECELGRVVGALDVDRYINGRRFPCLSVTVIVKVSAMLLLASRPCTSGSALFRV